jgi:Mlc titration factor MtfA (ptsG expression regulator)
VIALGAVGLVRYVHKRAERKLRMMPPPPEWEPILRQTSPLVFRLNPEQRNQLFGYMQLFLNRVRFEGCGGQKITEKVRVTIAAQACLLLIGREHRVYPKLKTVLVYPHTYSSGRKGVFGGDNGEGSRLGESWDYGVVVLAWDSVVGGARNLQDGHNVSLHEFAHQLDQENDVEGVPVLGQGSAYATWARVFSSDFARLCEKTDQGERDVIDAYGATNPAEFFAVATETFFEQPHQLQGSHPELFERLRAYYCLNPLEWNL